MDKNTLRVTTLGGFSVIWNGEHLEGKLGAIGGQFRYLLQVLLHSGPEGISREQLEAILFEGADLSDVHHSLRSAIYNAERKLKKLGLPDVDFIECRHRTFSWTKNIPVVEDAALFDDLLRQASGQRDQDAKLELLLRAAALYGGEFLPEHAESLWAVSEKVRMRKSFCACVEEAASLLQMRQDFRRMEELGRRAAKVDPLSDWETVTMEALAAMGRFEDAQRLYDSTVDLYLREIGVKPSQRMLEPLEKLADQMRHYYAPLEDIQLYIAQETNDARVGGYLCPYPVFRGIYQFVGRMLERSGQAVFLMLCTMVDGKDNPLCEGKILDTLEPKLESAIRLSVRQSDTVSRYGKGQYLVLLLNTTREDCEIVQRRIDRRFREDAHRTHVHYTVRSVDLTQHA